MSKTFDPDAATYIPNGEAIPLELRELRRWINWVPVKKGKSWTKVPINPSGNREAKTNDSQTWTDFNHAFDNAKKRSKTGLGFVFSDHDKYVGIDIDDCFDPETGELTEFASDIVDRLASYTEFSPSRSGLHIICKGEIPYSVKTSAIEIYSSGRYFTITGDIFNGYNKNIRQCVPELRRICEDSKNHKTPVNQVGSGEYWGEGERNNKLTSEAGKLRRGGYSVEQIVSVLNAINETKCNPPLDKDEVERIAKSISRYSPAPKQNGHDDDISLQIYIDDLDRIGCPIEQIQSKALETFGVSSSSKIELIIDELITIKNTDKACSCNEEGKKATIYECPRSLWIEPFSRVIDAGSEPSWETWVGTFSALAAIAQRNIRANYHGYLYGMAYSLLVKPTGLGKSECTNLCEALLPKSYRIRDKVQSGEALGPLLADIEYGTGKQKNEIKSVESRPTMMLIDEFTSLIQATTFKSSTLLDTLNTLFHRSRPWNLSRSSTTGGDLVIPDPTLTICATTTNSLLIDTVATKSNLLQSGFLNRYLILPGTMREWKLISDRADMDYTSFGKTYTHLCGTKWIKGSIWQQFTPEAMELARSYGEGMLSPIMNSELINDMAYKRLHVYMLIISMIYAWGSANQRIHKEHVQAAIDVVDTSRRFLSEMLDAESTDAPHPSIKAITTMEHRILEKISENPGITERNLARSFCGKSVKISDIRSSIQSMVDLGIIRRREQSTGSLTIKRLWSVEDDSGNV